MPSRCGHLWSTCAATKKCIILLKVVKSLLTRLSRASALDCNHHHHSFRSRVSLTSTMSPSQHTFASATVASILVHSRLRPHLGCDTCRWPGCHLGHCSSGQLSCWERCVLPPTLLGGTPHVLPDDRRRHALPHRFPLHLGRDSLRRPGNDIYDYLVSGRLFGWMCRLVPWHSRDHRHLPCHPLSFSIAAAGVVNAPGQTLLKCQQFSLIFLLLKSYSSMCETHILSSVQPPAPSLQGSLGFVSIYSRTFITWEGQDG